MRDWGEVAGDAPENESVANMLAFVVGLHAQERNEDLGDYGGKPPTFPI